MTTILEIINASLVTGLGSILILVSISAIVLLGAAYWAYDIKQGRNKHDRLASLQLTLVSAAVLAAYVMTAFIITGTVNEQTVVKTESEPVIVGSIDSIPAVRSADIVINDTEMIMNENFEMKVGNEISVITYDVHIPFSIHTITRHEIIHVRDTPPAHYANTN